MNGIHYTEDDLLDRLYGIGRGDTHLETCQACRGRWLELARRRKEVLSVPELASEWLAAQRRKVYERLERGERGASSPRFAPASALALVALVAVMLVRPAPRVEPVIAQNDRQFFAEAHSLISSDEPQATAPIRYLFEERQ